MIIGPDSWIKAPCWNTFSLAIGRWRSFLYRVKCVNISICMKQFSILSYKHGRAYRYCEYKGKIPNFLKAPWHESLIPKFAISLITLWQEPLYLQVDLYVWQCFIHTIMHCHMICDLCWSICGFYEACSTSQCNSLLWELCPATCSLIIPYKMLSDSKNRTNWWSK